MMYFSTSFRNIKLKQDYADCINTEDLKKIIICDGIGSFVDSAIVSQIVGENFINNIFSTLEDIIEIPNHLISREIIKDGGTTIILAKTDNNRDVFIEYIGNGGIIDIAGDFAETPYSDYPYRYAELLLPHVNPNGFLTKHLSHNSGKNELAPSKLKLTPNHPTGNIILLYSDGISSLENNLILKDKENRYWRNESPAIQYILNLLDSFLIEFCNVELTIDTFQDNLSKFNGKVLDALNRDGYLEDDASLGIIITQPVLDYYLSKSNA